VLVSDAVSAGGAIIFLAGTNLGAAAYEYGLARATRVFLRHHVAVEAQTSSREPNSA
jgi:hypothetical protein